ncbi:MAG: ribonuclease P protein component [Oscillospiraceae bacterium]|jgi:ribonuclease P protein component
MLKFSETMKKNYEFRRLYSKGKSAATPVLVIYCRRTKRAYNRIGITVTNKIGKAVHRNRVRRRIREIYRLNEHRLLPGTELVIVARVRSRYVCYQELERAFLTACKRLNVLVKKESGDQK